MADNIRPTDRVAVAALVAMAFLAGVLARQAFPQELVGYMTVTVYEPNGVPRFERVTLERRP